MTVRGIGRTAHPGRMRFAAVVTTAAAVVAVTAMYGFARERAALPSAAAQFLQATIQAGAVTTCLAGVQDDIYMPGQGRLHTRVATQGALDRLRTCDLVPLQRQLDRVHLPPASPVLDRAHRQAAAAISAGVLLLRRVVLDARGAALAMARDLASGGSDGEVVILAYRSAQTGSDRAYALAVQAQALLGSLPT